MLRIGVRRSAPAKAKTERRREAPAKAKKRVPDEGPPKNTAGVFKRVNANGEGEAERLTDRYLNRYPDKAVEVWLRGKLAYRAYGIDHPLNTRGREIAQKRAR